MTRKDAEKGILESRLRNLVDTILDTIVDGVITINERGEIQSYNRACMKLFGYSLEEVVGRNVSMLMPEPYRHEHDGYMENYHRTRQAKIIGIGREVAGRRKDGSVFPMELAVGETTMGGEHAFVGIIRDITERKESEKEREQLRQAQKMEAIGQLTGGIAHDFNNLLAVIMGNLDFMDERIPDGDVLKGFITPCIDAAEHGSDLTRQLLAFGRKQTLNPKNICVNDLITKFSNLVSRTLGERVELIYSLSSDLWKTNVDPTQLENALLNLSINARDAMPDGGKLIYETTNLTLDEDRNNFEEDIPEGDYVVIAVSDTGCGMSCEVTEKAFEPFFTTKEVGKGSGLGLSMVYGFVKQSSGHVKIYSEVGHGTTIKIFLPKVDTGTTSPFGGGGRRDNQQRGEGGFRMMQHEQPKMILVVEDNKNVLKMTSSMVESMGYEVIVAENGDAAMKIIDARDDIDMLLTDVMLPGTINGPALARIALQKRPGLKVLFNSGYAEHAIVQSGMLEEGVNLISKPFRKSQLAAKINEVMNSGS